VYRPRAGVRCNPSPLSVGHRAVALLRPNDLDQADEFNLCNCALSRAGHLDA
jgi:hypothetical protein